MGCLNNPFLILRGWAENAWTSFKNRGYLLVVTLIAAYVGIYSILEARHERRVNRALFERNTFMAMVVSGNPVTFSAAMRMFGPVQKMMVPRDPEFLVPQTWFEQEMPNEAPLKAWAIAFFPLCEVKTCGKPTEVKNWRLDLTKADLRQASLQEADLREAYLSDALVQEADLREANLREADLRQTFLRQADLREADLQEANLEKANLFQVDLRNVSNLTQAQLNTACVDESTKLPRNLTRPEPCPPDPRQNWPFIALYLCGF